MYYYDVIHRESYNRDFRMYGMGNHAVFSSNVSSVDQKKLMCGGIPGDPEVFAFLRFFHFIMA